MAAVARALGQIWTSLSNEQKVHYQQQAAVEREAVAQATAAWTAAGGVVPSLATTTHTSTSELIFPVARIRKICKLDPDVRGISKEALVMITKAAELCVTKLGTECVKMAHLQNRRKLQIDDVAEVCGVREQFQFLREDITDLHRQHQKMVKTMTTTTKKAVVEADKSTKRLTAYFQSAD
mgnify:CR=1 FL=1